MPLPLQLHTRPPEGLVVIWDAEPGVARYAFIVGIADAPAPEIDTIMQGRTREFAMLGIPTRFTGAVDIGTPAGEERQYGLFAYKSDGSLKPVSNLRFIPARNAPRDREYHPLLPPALERDKNRSRQSPAAKPAAGAEPTASAPRAQSATPTQPATPREHTPPRPADPWDILDGGKKATPPQDEARQPERARETEAQRATPPDPWAVLDRASDRPPTPQPAPSATTTERASGAGATKPRETVPDPWDIAAGTPEGRASTPPPPPPDRARPAQRPTRAPRPQPARRPAPLVDLWDELELELRLNPDPDPGVPAYYKDPLAYLYARERAEATALGLPLPTYLEPEAPPPVEPIVETVQVPDIPRDTHQNVPTTEAAATEPVTAAATTEDRRPPSEDARESRDGHTAATVGQEQPPTEPTTEWDTLQATVETPVGPAASHPGAASEAETLVIEQAATVVHETQAIDPIEAELRAMWATEEVPLEPVIAEAVPLVPEPISEVRVPSLPQPTLFDLLGARYDLPGEYLQQALPLAAIDRVARRLVLLRHGNLKDHGAIIAGNRARRRAAAEQAAASRAIPLETMDERPALPEEPVTMHEEAGTPITPSVEAAGNAALAESLPADMDLAVAVADEHAEEAVAAIEHGGAPLPEDAAVDAADQGPSTETVAAAIEATPDDARHAGPVEVIPDAAFAAAESEAPSRAAAAQTATMHTRDLAEPEGAAAPNADEDQIDDAQAAPAAPEIADEPSAVARPDDEPLSDGAAQHLPYMEAETPAPADEPMSAPMADAHLDAEDTPTEQPSERDLTAERREEAVAATEQGGTPPADAADDAQQQVTQAQDSGPTLPTDGAGAPDAAIAAVPISVDEHPAPLAVAEPTLPEAEAAESAQPSDVRLDGPASEPVAANEPADLETSEVAADAGAQDATASQPVTESITDVPLPDAEALPLPENGNVLALPPEPDTPLEPALVQEAHDETEPESPAQVKNEAEEQPTEANAGEPTPPEAATSATAPAPAREDISTGIADIEDHAEPRAATAEPILAADAVPTPAEGEAAAYGGEPGSPEEETAPLDAPSRVVPEHEQAIPGIEHEVPASAAGIAATVAPPPAGIARAGEHEQSAPTPDEQSQPHVAREEVQTPETAQPAEAIAGDVHAGASATRAEALPATAHDEPVPPASPEVAAMLDEAELYLLPQWADYAEAARILERAAALAPREPRLLALREGLVAAQRGGPNIDGLLQEAQQRLDARDHWGAVDLYEQALAQQPGDERAARGLERARLLARWAARLAGAGNDAPGLQQLGAEYAESAPELAAQAYAEAFAVEATILSLRGWLAALAAAGRWTDLGAVARRGLVELRRQQRVSEDPAPDAAAAAIERDASTQTRQAVDGAIAAFAQALVAHARRPQPDRSEQHDDHGR